MDEAWRAERTGGGGTASPVLPWLSVVVPARDEAASLPQLLDELGTVLDELGRPAEIVVVDDGSRDGSVDLVRRRASRDPRIRLVRLGRPAGLTAALHAGLRAARGEVIVTLDADLQNDPRDIPRLLAALGDADAVIGWRRRRRDPWVKRAASRAANVLRRALTGDGVRDGASGLRALTRECIADLPPFDGMHRFVPTLLALAGRRVVEVPVAHRRRRYGRSHFGLRDRLPIVLADLLVLRWMRARWLAYEAVEVLGGGRVRRARVGARRAPPRRRSAAVRRLAALWLGVGLALAGWGFLGRPAPGTPLGPGPIEIVLAPERPPGGVLSVSVHWDAPAGSVGWAVLEGARPWSSAEELSWRRRVHPGRNELVWSELGSLPVGEPLRLRLSGEPQGRWDLAPPRLDPGFGLVHLTPLRGVLAALGLALVLTVTAGLRVLRGRAGRGQGRWWLGVASIAALAMLLRLHTLAVPSLWFDEVLTAIGAQSLAWVLHTPQVFGHPPLHYLAAWVAGGGSGDEWSLRVPSLAAGVATVVALAWLGRRLLGPTSGLVAALALSLSPFHVELSQLARPYALFLLLTVLSLGALVRALERDGARDWLAVSVTLALGLYTHYFALHVLVLEALTAAVVLRRRPRRLLGAAVAVGGALVLFLPWWPVVARLSAAQLWRGDLPVRAVHELVVEVFAPQFLGPGAAGTIGAALVAAALWSLRRRGPLVVLAGLWLVLPPAALWVTQPAHFVAGRHLAFVLPIVMLLLGHGVVGVAAWVARLVPRRVPSPGRVVRLGAAASAGALVLAWSVPTAGGLRDYYQGRHGADWRTVAAVLERLVGSQDRVFATVGALYPLRHYWSVRVEGLEAAGFPGAPVGGRGRHWVVAHEGWDRPPSLPAWLETHAVRVAAVPASWSQPGVAVYALRVPPSPPQRAHAVGRRAGVQPPAAPTTR